jgi:hypothetical protein
MAFDIRTWIAVWQVESRMGAGANAWAPSRFPSPLIKPDVRISRTLCGAPHKMRYVASRIMWRPASKPRGISEPVKLDAT